MTTAELREKLARRLTLGIEPITAAQLAKELGLDPKRVAQLIEEVRA